MESQNKTLTQKIAELLTSPVVTTGDFSIEHVEKYKEIKKNFENHSVDERKKAIQILNKTIQKIAAEKQDGQSNYVFFMLVKLRKNIQDSIQLRDHEIKLSRSSALKYFNFQKVPIDFKGLPSSPEEYIFTAKQCKYFQDRNAIKIMPPSIPVMFYLNPEAFLFWKSKSFHFNLSTGHCLFGFYQSEDKLKALTALLSQGLLLSDQFIYDHVDTFRKKFKKSVLKTYINLDTIYYGYKLQQILPRQEHLKINYYIDKLVNDHLDTINRTLPDSTVCREDDANLEYSYNKIIREFGLLDFIINNIKSFRGIDLNEQKQFALSLSYVAATYLYSPLILNTPSLSIESALNVEVPSQIVVPFLESLGKENLFCFAGVFPLPDISMTNGSMTYGDTENGKIFVNDSDALAVKKAKNFYRNWVVPYRCWYTAFFLSKGKSFPDKLCAQVRCNLHSDILLKEIQKDIFSQ